MDDEFDEVGEQAWKPPVARHPRLEAILERFGDRELSPHDAEPHWACPDCGQPCRCKVPELRHARCGLHQT
jgi:hypothetical protein